MYPRPVFLRFAFALAALAALAAVPGCSMIARLGGGHGTETSMSIARGARYDGPECARVLYQLDELGDMDYNALSTTVDESPASQVLLAVCARREKSGCCGHDVPQWPRIAPTDPITSYLGQDDWRLDPIQAALATANIVNGLGATINDGAYHVGPASREIGLAVFWTQVVSPDDVRAGLEALELPAGARTALLAQFTAAPTRFAGLLSPAEHHLLVTLPVAVVQARREHYATYQALYQRLYELRLAAVAVRNDKAQLAPTVAALEQLRSEFAAQCGVVACISMPLYALASHELALLHVLAGDVLLAHVESWHNARSGGYVAGMAQAIRVAQEAFLAKNAEMLAKYTRAKESGVDEAAAQQLAGGAPLPDFDRDLLAEPVTHLPDYADAIDDHPDEIGYRNAFVAQVRGSGRARTIVFKKDKFESEEPYDCRRTNRITRIQSDGAIEYETDCKYRSRTELQEQHAPIAVPAAEAAKLRAGDMVYFREDGERAYVLQVKRGDAVVQVRSDWFGA